MLLFLLFLSFFFGFFVFFHERAVFSNGITSSVTCDNSMYLPVRSVHNPHCDRTIPSPWYSVPSLVLLVGTFDSVLLNNLLPFCFRLFTWWLQSSFSISYLYFLFFVFGVHTFLSLPPSFTVEYQAHFRHQINILPSGSMFLCNSCPPRTLSRHVFYLCFLTSLFVSSTCAPPKQRPSTCSEILLLPHLMRSEFFSPLFCGCSLFSFAQAAAFLFSFPLRPPVRHVIALVFQHEIMHILRSYINLTRLGRILRTTICHPCAISFGSKKGEPSRLIISL